MIPFDASGAFYPVAEGREVRRLAVRGAAATVSGAALSLAAQVISTAILARLLTPADFGVVAMVTTFCMLLMSFGTSGLILTIGFAAPGSLLARFYEILLLHSLRTRCRWRCSFPGPDCTHSSPRGGSIAKGHETGRGTRLRIHMSQQATLPQRGAAGYLAKGLRRLPRRGLGPIEAAGMKIHNRM
jgi:hypothetical protein